MGLKADIDEVSASWSKSPWWVKAWLCVSGYLAISSIASVADTVFKWKGFFKDALYFYSNFITEPLRKLLASLEIHLSNDSTDIVIIQAIGFMSLLRVFACNRHFIKPKEQIWHFSFFIIGFCLLIIANIGLLNNIAPAPLTPIFKWIIILNNLVLMPAVMCFPFISFAFLYYIQLIFIFIVICLLAAVNRGLFG